MLDNPAGFVAVNFPNKSFKYRMDIPTPEKKKKMNRFRSIAFAIAVLFVAVAAYGLVSLNNGLITVNGSTILMDKVQRGTFINNVRGPGYLVADEFRLLAAESSGQVATIVTRPGSRVTADTVIIELTSPDLVEAAESSRWEAEDQVAELAELRARLESERLDLLSKVTELGTLVENAQAQADAEESLAIKGIVSKLQAQRSITELNGAIKRKSLEEQRLAQFEKSMRTRLTTQNERTKHFKKVLRQKLERVERLTVRAGIDGVLQQVYVDEGQRVAIGSTMARIANPDKLIAELLIAETQAKDVRIGQAAKIDTRSEVIEGSVLRIEPAVENGTVQIDVTFDNENVEDARLDLSVDGSIELQRVDNALFVGRPTGVQPDEKVNVFVLDSNTKIASRRQVTFGKRSTNFIEVLDGLNEGETIILSDTNIWDELDQVKIK